jgi:plasmid stability protein
MGQVLIRNLDDHVIHRWKMRAELRGHSLEQELRLMITQQSGLSTEEKLALADRIRAKSLPGSEEIDSTDLIREDRDSR